MDMANWFAPHHGTWLDFFDFNLLPLCVRHCMKSTEFEYISMIVEIWDNGERTVGGDCRVIKKKRVKFAWWFAEVATADSNKIKVDIAMQDFRYHMKESRPSTRFNIAVLHVDYSVLSQQEIQPHEPAFEHTSSVSVHIINEIKTYRF